MSAKNAFCNGIWVEVFNFWFYIMEKVCFSMFVSIVYWNHKANMADIALFFDRTDRIAGISGLQKT